MGKGLFVTILVIVVLLAAGLFYATQNGLLDDSKAAATKELKADIEALEGPNIEQKIVSYFSGQIEGDTVASKEEKQEFKEAIDQAAIDNDVNFAYESLTDLDVLDKAAVKIASPSITAKDSVSGEEFKITASGVEVRRDLSNPNHFTYKETTPIEIYTGALGDAEKVFVINYETDGTEIRLSDAGEIEYAKGSARNVEFLGNGGALLFKIREVSTEQINKVNGDKVSQSLNMAYNGIEPGDIVKIMFGQIEPLGLKMDFNYNGDKLSKAYSNYAQQSDNNMRNIQDALAGKKIVPLEDQKLEAFEGDLNLNNFSFLMGDAGIKANGDVTFAGDVIPQPTGSVELVLTNYEKLISFGNKFMPMPQSEIDKGINFLKEIGQENGDDIIFNLSLNGAEEMRVGGKTMEEVEAIQMRYMTMSVEGLDEAPIPVELMENSEELIQE